MEVVVAIECYYVDHLVRPNVRLESHVGAHLVGRRH